MTARPHTALPLEGPANPGFRRSSDGAVRTWSGAGLVPATSVAGADALIVVDGVVSVSLVTTAGRVIGLALLGPGEVWTAGPDDAGLGGFRIDAICPSRLRLTSVETLLRLVSDAEVARALVRVLLRRAGVAERRYAALAALCVEDRVMALLHLLARLRGIRGPRGIRIDLDLSQDRIACLTGTTRESVNRALRALQRDGFVRREGLRYEVAGGGS
ncbi:MAG TPA: Crp/Fnr family transcriptional regulator [Actinomycetota bacterium]|nr:Crp/Fnr family transcriptional regulator [Actinomycetota bacterium]